MSRPFRWLFTIRILVTLSALLFALFASAVVADDTALYSLEQFGPVTTPAEATATLEKAGAAIIGKGGGVLVIPRQAPAKWVPQNISQGAWRQPEPPAPATAWGNTPGVTVLDYRDGTMKVWVPQLTGLGLERTFLMPDGQSATHWNMHPMLWMKNDIVRGSTSYLEPLREDVTAGPDRRFYMATIRGVFPGEFLTAGTYGKVARLYVKSIGYDTEKKMPYFVADVDQDIRKGTNLHNKNHVNYMRLDTASHTENQSADVANWRHDYSQGDTYLFDGRFYYMSDVHFTGGDENGVIYAATVHSEDNAFRGQVAAFDAKSNELQFKKGSQNSKTLGTGRPLINLNETKWITGGTVEIVRPATWWDLNAQGLKDPVYAGKMYPTRLVTNQFTGLPELSMGGLIHFSAEAPITDAVVGRYFAVAEPSECVDGTVRRWYLIDHFQKNADGTKDIKIIRHWWGAKAAGAPTLYQVGNYSTDGHQRPLRYVIAPGANVYDVAAALDESADKPSLKIAPGPDTGSSADFAPGDAIEQAIGPDPFKPIPMRAWVFDKVPGVFPSPIFDVANDGVVARAAVLSVHGGKGDADEVTNRADRLPPWENIIVINSVSRNGIVFGADTLDSAITFAQPHGRPQPIKWRYAAGTKEASLTVSPEDGTLKFDGGGITASGGLLDLTGLSGTGIAAHNLRGINVSVATGSNELQVKFVKPEADVNYAIFVEPSWLTAHAVTLQTVHGFTVTFAHAPKKPATLHWLLVR